MEPAKNDGRQVSSPWERPQWKREVLTWISAELGRHGMSVDGPVDARVRPWSVVLKIRSGRRVVWFKANAPGSAFEPALSDALSRWRPSNVLAPLAIDVARAWLLLPDGGPTLAEALDVTSDVTAWDEPLRSYAALQQTTAGRVAELRRIGVPDLTPGRLPELFSQLLDRADVRRQIGVRDGLDPVACATARSLQPCLAAWCQSLAESEIPMALDHSDLNENNILVGGRSPVFYDWGDSAVAHPFTSMFVPGRVLAERFSAAGRQRWPAVLDAFLENWTEYQTLPELRRTARLAALTAHVGRALTWSRVFPETTHDVREEHARQTARWIGRLVESVAPLR